MTVILARQSKMARAFRCILRLLHAAQRQPADQRASSGVPSTLSRASAVQLPGVSLPAPSSPGKPKLLIKRLRRFTFSGIRIIMGPVNKRRLKPVKVL